MHQHQQSNTSLLNLLPNNKLHTYTNLSYGILRIDFQVYLFVQIQEVFSCRPIFADQPNFNNILFFIFLRLKIMLSSFVFDRLCASWNNKRGPFSDAVSCTTLQTTPTNPSMLRVIQKTKTAITLKWNVSHVTQQ